MDVRSFSSELLRALADTGLFERVALRIEGPVADGQAYVREELFLRFYFNESTGTVAFALIEENQRIWGIDSDDLRGWHMHPVDNPAAHIQVNPMSVSEIIACLQDVLLRQRPGHPPHRTRPGDDDYA